MQNILAFVLFYNFFLLIVLQLPTYLINIIIDWALFHWNLIRMLSPTSHEKCQYLIPHLHVVLT